MKTIIGKQAAKTIESQGNPGEVPPQSSQTGTEKKYPLSPRGPGFDDPSMRSTFVPQAAERMKVLLEVIETLQQEATRSPKNPEEESDNQTLQNIIQQLTDLRREAYLHGEVHGENGYYDPRIPLQG